MLDEDDIKEMRRIRLLDLILWSILSEAGIYATFVLLLYVISFFNLNNSSFVYNQLFLDTFVNKRNQNEFGLTDVFINSLYLKIFAIFRNCFPGPHKKFKSSRKTIMILYFILHISFKLWFRYFYWLKLLNVNKSS